MALISDANTKSKCASYATLREIPQEEYSTCKERVYELRAEEGRECSSKEYEWNTSENRCNTDEEQEELVKKRTEEEAQKAEAERRKVEELEAQKQKAKTECENKQYYNWDGSNCVAETWTKELSWSEVENSQCYVDAIYDKIDDDFGYSYDVLKYSDGIEWSAKEYYSGGTLTKTDVFFGYMRMKSKQIFMGKCEVKNCKCVNLDSRG